MFLVKAKWTGLGPIARELTKGLLTFVCLCFPLWLYGVTFRIALSFSLLSWLLLKSVFMRIWGSGVVASGAGQKKVLILYCFVKICASICLIKQFPHCRNLWKCFYFSSYFCAGVITILSAGTVLHNETWSWIPTLSLPLLFVCVCSNKILFIKTGAHPNGTYGL